MEGVGVRVEVGEDMIEVGLYVTISKSISVNFTIIAICYHTIRYDTRCYFNVRSKADISQLNLPHGTDN